MNLTAVLINRILERLGPWYQLRFVKIDPVNAQVLVHIGSHRVIACMDPADNRVWVRRGNASPSDSEVQFLFHLNGILAGKVRNDAGELVSA